MEDDEDLSDPESQVPAHVGSRLLVLDTDDAVLAVHHLQRQDKMLLGCITKLLP